MRAIRPVEMPTNAFNFCKFTLAGLLWMSLLLRSRNLLILALVILILSAVLKVGRAPLVLLYKHTVERIRPSRIILLDENAVCFAHWVGAVFAAAALALMYSGFVLAGWVLTGVLALLKTSGACGKCGAMKLYSCMNDPNGKCCRFGKQVKKRTVMR